MANATAALLLEPYGKGGRDILIGVGVTAQLFKGIMVSQLAADGGAVATTTALSGKAVGVAAHDVLGGAAVGDERVELETDRIFLFDNAAGPDDVDETLELFSTVFAEDDHTISDNDQGTLPVAGLFAGIEPNGQIRVFIGFPSGPSGGLAVAAAAGTDTLVAGAVTVAETSVRADSSIQVTPKGVSGSTDFSYLDVDTITPGVSFTIEAKTIAHAADGDAIGDVMWTVTNP